MSCLAMFCIMYIYVYMYSQLLDGEEKKDFRETGRGRGSQICISGS